MRLTLVFAASFTLLLALTPRGSADEPKLNVLFIAVDDLKPTLGCAGDPYAKTSHIDRLAQRGTVFTRAYCQQAVCNPLRSSLLTGCRPDTIGVWQNTTHFRDKHPHLVTLPQYFKNHGYYVHGVGKIYHGSLTDEASWRVPWEASQGRGFGEQRQKLLAELRAKAKAAAEDVTRVRGLPLKVPDVADDYLNNGWTAQRASAILKARKGQKEPFVLAVGFIKPHLSFVAPRKYWDLYEADKPPAAESSKPPQGAPAFALTNSAELRAYHDIPATGPIPPDTAKKLVHGYCAAVSYMDVQVGRVLDALKDHGFADNTVIILWGDHGWHLGDHGMWCKHTNYEQATRAPLVMSRPDQKAPGRTTEALVELIDIYPTLVEVCGLPRRQGVEGHSFAPLLDDLTQRWKAAAFSSYPRSTKDTGPLMGYAIRTDRYRYVEWRKRTNGEVVARELYD